MVAPHRAVLPWSKLARLKSKEAPRHGRKYESTPLTVELKECKLPGNERACRLAKKKISASFYYCCYEEVKV